MKSDEIKNIILDESEDIIYISDPYTYELIYINKCGLTMFGITENEKITDKKCYKILQSKDKPCDFCTNSFLKKDKFYTWTHYNKSLNEYFSIKDKLIEVNGKELRLEIATNITRNEIEKQKLASELSNEQTLVKCIQTLAEHNNIETATNKLLSIIADFYKGECAYVLEINYEEQTFSKTYEWNMKKIASETKKLQNLSLALIEHWISECEIKGELYIEYVNKILNKEGLEHQILAGQGIKKLIIAPLRENDKIIGFIGVNNPTININDLSLLKSVTFFVMDDMQKRKLLMELEKMSFIDMLTGLNNRNKYINTLIEIEKNSPKSLGIIYMDLNGLKIINDTYGHDYGDKVLKDLSKILTNIFKKNIFRIGGDEFVVFCIDVKKEKFESDLKSFRNRIELEKEINISIGSEWNTGKIQVNKQIAQADKLMYLEKKRCHKIWNKD